MEGRETLSDEQARSDFVVTGLRRVAGVDATGFERRFAIALDAAFPQLAHLVRDGLVEHDGARVRLTARGLRFADTVGALLI